MGFTAEENALLRAFAVGQVALLGSQEKLAEKLNMMQPSLSNFLRGKPGTSWNTARKLAELEGMDVDTLLASAPPATEPPPERIRERRESPRPPVQRNQFSTAEHAKLRALAQRLIKKRFGTQASLAAELGMRQASLSSFLLGKVGAGLETANRLAELANKDLATVIGRPITAPSGSAAHARVKYPNRTIVVDCARRMGFSDAAIKRLMELQLGNADDAAPKWWLARLTRFEDEVSDEIQVTESTKTR